MGGKGKKDVKERWRIGGGEVENGRGEKERQKIEGERRIDRR